MVGEIVPHLAVFGTSAIAWETRCTGDQIRVGHVQAKCLTHFTVWPRSLNFVTNTQPNNSDTQIFVH